MKSLSNTAPGMVIKVGVDGTSQIILYDIIHVNFVSIKKDILKIIISTYRCCELVMSLLGHTLM